MSYKAVLWLVKHAIKKHDVYQISMAEFSFQMSAQAFLPISLTAYYKTAKMLSTMQKQKKNQTDIHVSFDSQSQYKRLKISDHQCDTRLPMKMISSYE